MKTVYGVTIGSSSELAALPEMKAIQLLEIPGEMCTDDGGRQLRSRKHKKLMVNNSSDIRFFRSLFDAGSGVRQDFYRLFFNKCQAAAELGAAAVSLAPDLEGVAGDQAKFQRLQRTLGMCFGAAEKYRLPLNLELRIPGAVSAAPAEFVRLKHRLLYPLRTMCVLHPHEPGALEAMENFSGKCKFDCDMFRIVFDAAFGNYISGHLFRKLLSFVRPSGAAAPVVIFDPGRGADSHAFAELDRLVEEVAE